MNETNFKTLVRELIDENPFAVRAVLKILNIVFTDRVPTLAVTCTQRPQLLVNPAFIKEHCRTQAHVKALICHEFLHILLRHTERRSPVSPQEHLALDAVINAIIHRTLGPSYSSMMGTYYADATGLMRLLRPMTEAEENKEPRGAWRGLYAGTLVADDIEELAMGFDNPWGITLGRLLGGHADGQWSVTGPVKEALEGAMRAMNGSGIWRSPRERGLGALSYPALFTAKDEAILKWKRTTAAVLRKHLLPDPRSRLTILQETVCRMPVQNTKDRRAFMRSMWDPFIPEASWSAEVPKRLGTAQIYLDVSGSMSAEMPHLISLLGSLRAYIKTPFWAFSTEVCPAVIEGGMLKTSTSGGTSLACVLEHLARTKPASAVVITDGFIEDLSPQDVKKTAGVRLHAIVARDGNPAALAHAGIAYTQLERSPV